MYRKALYSGLVSSINDLFFFVKIAFMHNFVDDYTLSTWVKTVSKLIDMLESENNIAVDWFTMIMKMIIKMTLNPDKFQAIVLDKKKTNLTNIPLTIDNQTIKLVSLVELLGIYLGDKLKINLYISNICRSAANQLNALIRLKSYLSFNAKRVLINSYIILNFNHCPLVWIFSTGKSLKKIESLQRGALRFLYSDYSISYEGLLEKAGKAKMSVNRLRTLCVEIYKTINKLNPEFMNNIFTVKVNKRLVRHQYKLNFETPELSQITFGGKSLKVSGSKVWNSLPFHIERSENLIQSNLMKNWKDNFCSCTVCTK